MSQEVTLRDNQGVEAVVTLAGIPAKGDKIVLTVAGRTNTSVKEVVFTDDQKVIVQVVDGFGRIYASIGDNGPDSTRHLLPHCCNPCRPCCFNINSPVALFPLAFAFFAFVFMWNAFAAS